VASLCRSPTVTGEYGSAVEGESVATANDLWQLSCARWRTIKVSQRTLSSGASGIDSYSEGVASPPRLRLGQGLEVIALARRELDKLDTDAQAVLGPLA
jgi:hypothetical protein